MDEMDVICSFEKWSTKVLIFMQQKLGIDTPKNERAIHTLQKCNVLMGQLTHWNCYCYCYSHLIWLKSYKKVVCVSILRL